MCEIWKQYVDNYYVSNYGNVKNIRTNRILKCTSKNGYKQFIIKGKSYKVHKAVADIFISNPYSLNMINHKDGNKQNNHINNLERCNGSYNTKHAYNNNLISKNKGVDNHMSKLTLNDVNFIKKVYKKRDELYGGKALAKMFNVHTQTIYKIINNHTWL